MRKIKFALILLALFLMLTGCNTSLNKSNLKTIIDSNDTETPVDIAEFLINDSNNIYIENFAAAAQSISLLHAELYYIKTGVNSNSYAYGNLNNTAEYTIQNKTCENESFKIITKYYSLYITTGIAEIALPDNIKYNGSFADTLDLLELTDKVRNRKDERYFSVENDDKTNVIGVAFLSFHAEPVNTDFETASATIYFRETIEQEDENGRIHTYNQDIFLTFREGKLVNINFSLSDEYEAHDEPDIINEIVGIRFINPVDYTVETADGYFGLYLWEIYYIDGKIQTTYSVDTNMKPTEFTIIYNGWQSADNGILYETVTHTTSGWENFTDIINEPFGDSDYKPSWYNNLYENYLFFEIILFSSNRFSFEFLGGDISIYRGTSR